MLTSVTRVLALLAETPLVAVAFRSALTTTLRIALSSASVTVPPLPSGVSGAGLGPGGGLVLA